MSKPHTVPAAVWAAALLLTACATVPEPIRTASDGPDIAGVRQNPAAFTGKTVRWGGRVLGLTNEKEYSTLEVLAQRLQRNGRPVASDHSLGRFLIRVQGFLEPTDFERGRQVTVVGTVSAAVTRNIGDHPYLFPVVLAGTVHLWEEIVREPYYYDPFYHPYYFWPYWRHPYFFHRPYFSRYYYGRLPPRRLH